MNSKVNQTHISEELIKIFKTAKKFFVNFDSIDLKVSYKKDNSPLTTLDTEVDKFIKKELKKINQDFALISEETNQQQANSEYAWIIDPIDGTKELINGSDEFTLNIALIKNQKPVLGAIYQPMKDSIFLGGTDLPPKKIIDEKMEFLSNKYNQICNVLISKSHSSEEEIDFCEKVMSKFNGSKVIRMGSSLKFCSICEGIADLYPRFGDIYSWDIAAGHAILKAFGGDVLDSDLQEISYDMKEKQLIKGFFAFSNKKRLDFLRQIHS
jgi:3'(2'), 5'-bisphosphate nucleotidase